MYSLIVLLLTLLEVSVAVAGYALQSQALFYGALIYASPIYIFTHLLSNDSAFLEKSPIYIACAILHLIKYFSFFRAQMIEDLKWPFKAAIFLEATYLLASAYYSF